MVLFRSPLVVLVLVICLLSLCGFPGLAGFYSKELLFMLLAVDVWHYESLSQHNQVLVLVLFLIALFGALYSVLMVVRFAVGPSRVARLLLSSVGVDSSRLDYVLFLIPLILVHAAISCGYVFRSSLVSVAVDQFAWISSDCSSFDVSLVELLVGFRR
mgnify:CR=1 FL=1